MLPIFNTSIRELSMLETQWKSQLDPILTNPLNNAIILKNIVLASGNNVINTKLGRQAQGWFISDTNAAVSIYRSAPFNELTLTLNSSGAATVNIVVF